MVREIPPVIWFGMAVVVIAFLVALRERYLTLRAKEFMIMERARQDKKPMPVTKQALEELGFVIHTTKDLTFAVHKNGLTVTQQDKDDTWLVDYHHTLWSAQTVTDLLKIAREHNLNLVIKDK